MFYSYVGLATKMAWEERREERRSGGREVGREAVGRSDDLSGRATMQCILLKESVRQPATPGASARRGSAQP